MSSATFKVWRSGDDGGGFAEQTPDYGLESRGIYARRAAGILSHRSARSFPCQVAYAVVEIADTS